MADQVKKASKEVQLQRENERLRTKLHQQHMLVRELAAFTQGIMLCELVDNPSDTNAYNIGSMKVGQLVEIADRLTLGE